MNTSQQVDILSSEFRANPFPFLARLRAEQPVYRTALPDKTVVWLVTRYEDVVSLLKDKRFANSRYNGMTPEQLGSQPELHPAIRPAQRNLLALDVPDHTRLRTLVHKAFSPSLIEQMRVRTQILVDELLDTIEGDGETDIVRDYALPFSLTLITDILGVPPRDRVEFHKWSKIIISVYPFSDNNWRAFPVFERLSLYLRHFFKMRRSAPKDDLVSALIQAEEAGDRLNEDELLAMVILLLVAGHETTVSLIGNGMLALFDHPDQLEKLRVNPSLIKPAVEEMLRYTSPVFMSTERYARENMTLRGVNIQHGEIALAVFGSANRDETVFKNPDLFDIERENNKHVAFGQGLHFCLGAPLARMEAQIAISSLLRRLPKLGLKGSPESLRWRPGLMMRGLEALPAEF